MIFPWLERSLRRLLKVRSERWRYVRTRDRQAMLARLAARLGLLAVSLLPGCYAADCAAQPLEAADYFNPTNVKNLAATEVTALEALFALSASVPLPVGLGPLAGTTLCCAQDKDDSTEWSVAAVTSDSATCQSYGKTAPCALRKSPTDTWHLFDRRSSFRKRPSAPTLPRLPPWTWC